MVRAIALIVALVVGVATPACAAAKGGGKSSSKEKSTTSAPRSRGSPGGSHTVSGYTKKNGTYVAPYHATNPDGTKTNNYSTKGNINPYTGKEGTKDPNK